ncbi:hypothetical protein CDL15_Pgr015477 [Punica granatum]|nr:hypothetical protein CDL15_Pgr015477 [Punica granatum]
MSKRFFIGNDGGLKGDAGKLEYQEDAVNGEKGGFVVPDASDFFQDMDKSEFQTNYAGEWELILDNSGVSAMHLQLMPHNEVVIFDSTGLGPSKLALPPFSPCPLGPDGKPDCWAHAVAYNIETQQLRPLHVITDPWCSSGGLAVDGSLVSTGGFYSGLKSVRVIEPCSTCDWNKDTADVLGSPRWYATQAKLEDGSFFVIGGRKAYNYEYVTANGQANGQLILSTFMDETTDLDENNLYPFVHLLPDGNLFIFANSRSILFNPRTNQVIKEFPRLRGGSRNYPASGMSALLPIRLDENNKPKEIQVMVCGGAQPKAYGLADPERKGGRVLLNALQDCGRLVVSDPNPNWMREKMPSRRVMGDMLNLPTGDILMINGAKKGTAAWNHAAEPNYNPVLFRPEKVGRERFKVLKATTIPRMYHSTSSVLPDATILVGGSNTNPTYQFEGVEYPTEMRLEKFYPPYLDPALQHYQPEILQFDNRMTFGNDFHISFRVFGTLNEVPMRQIKVTMYAPPFTTHGYSMNQRLIQLGFTDLSADLFGVQHVTARAPPSGRIAPAGYYLVFVVYRGIPSVGKWVQIQ